MSKCERLEGVGVLDKIEWRAQALECGLGLYGEGVLGGWIGGIGWGGEGEWYEEGSRARVE